MKNGGTQKQIKVNKKLSSVSSIADSGSKKSVSDDEPPSFDRKEKKIAQPKAQTMAQAVLEKSNRQPKDYISKLKALDERASKGDSLKSGPKDEEQKKAPPVTENFPALNQESTIQI